MKKLLPLMWGAALVAGCVVMVPGHLYPVHGPLSAQSPLPVYGVVISGVLKSGTLKATLGGRETCSGAVGVARDHNGNIYQLTF